MYIEVQTDEGLLNFISKSALSARAIINEGPFVKLIVVEALRQARKSSVQGIRNNSK